jgi:hypothetical protein
MPTAGDDMDQILKALRDTAREEDRAERAALGEPGRVPALDEAARARIAGAILEVPAPVVSLDERRRARRRWAGLLVIPLAAAAGVLLMAHPRSSPPSTLPGYELVATGGLREVRGPADEPGQLQRLSPGSILEVKLRPASAVDGEVVGAAFLVQGDRIEPVDADIQVVASGAASVRAEAAPVFGDRRGRWELRILLARPALAKQLPALAADPRQSGPGWQRLSVPIELVP